MTGSSAAMTLPPPSLMDRLQQSESSDAAEMFVTATPPYVITHVSPAWSRLCGWRHNQAVREVYCHRKRQGVVEPEKGVARAVAGIEF